MWDSDWIISVRSQGFLVIAFLSLPLTSSCRIFKFYSPPIPNYLISFTLFSLYIIVYHTDCMLIYHFPWYWCRKSHSVLNPSTSKQGVILTTQAAGRHNWFIHDKFLLSRVKQFSIEPQPTVTLNVLSTPGAFLQ